MFIWWLFQTLHYLFMAAIVFVVICLVWNLVCWLADKLGITV